MQQILKQFDMHYHVKIPVQKHFIKKNSRDIMYNRRTKKPFIGKKADLANAEKYLIEYMQLHALKMGIREPLNEPVWAIFFFHFTKEQFFTKKGIMRQTIGDLSNLYQLPEDCLEKAGVIANDTLIMAHDYSRRLPAEKTELEIYLMKYSNPKMAYAIGQEINPLTSSLNLTDADYFND